VTTRRGYTILGWLVWQIGSRIAKRKASQKMAENRVKLGLAGTVLLVVCGILAALAARSRRSGGDEPAPAAAAPSHEEGPKEEGPDYGEGPGSPELGHRVGETQSVGGSPDEADLHREDVKRPPAAEDEQDRTQSSGSPADPESG
jgi:hypothetical protein